MLLERAETGVAALEAQPRVIREFLMRWVAPAWLEAKRKAYRQQHEKRGSGMEKTSWIVALALSVLLIPCSSAYAANPRILTAKVEGVSDGNTITAFTPEGTKFQVRLAGISAPEVPRRKKPGQPFGEEARNYLALLIGGRTVRVETNGNRGDKRILAVVFFGPINVNVDMVQQGLAEVNRGACQAYCRDLRVAELRAKRDRVGMWAQREKYESPAAFRKRMQIAGG